MKEYIEIYNKNREKIETIIENSIEGLGKINNEAHNFYKKLFVTFPSLEIIYIVDATTKVQTSANIYSQYNDDSERQKKQKLSYQ